MSTHPSTPSLERFYIAEADTGQLTVSHCPSYHCSAHSHYKKPRQVTNATGLASSLRIKYRNQTNIYFCSFFVPKSFMQMLNSPSHQDSRDLTCKSLSHFTTSDICNTVKCQAHEGRVAAGKIILDGIIDKTNQLTVAVYQHRDK